MHLTEDTIQLYCEWVMIDRSYRPHTLLTDTAAFDMQFVFKHHSSSVYIWVIVFC